MKNARGRGEIGEEWGKKEGEGNRREGRGHPVILAFVHPDMKYNTELMTFVTANCWRYIRVYCYFVIVYNYCIYNRECAFV